MTLLRPKATTAVCSTRWVGNTIACISLLRHMSPVVQDGSSRVAALGRVTEECAIHLHLSEGRFECMQTIENGNSFPRGRAELIWFGFGRTKGLPNVELVANIVEK